jgi:hypothetical protein
VPLREPDYVAVYDRVSMVEHSCRANCNKSFSSSGEIVSTHQYNDYVPQEDSRRFSDGIVKMMKKSPDFPHYYC